VRRLTLKAMLIVALAPSFALAQWPPERLKNVQVLPKDLAIRALVDTMAGFTRALGVRCAYCHVGGETTPFDFLDFSSDSMPAKVKAREMLRMVLAINRDHLPKLTDRRTPPIVVTCATCHRGVAQPRPLQQVLLTAYDAGGVDSTEAAYRALRQRYYGAAAYDFGEVPLADVASVLRVRGKLPDALRMHSLNIEFSPRSGFALRQAAGAQLAAGDTAAAVADLERALSLNANDSQARGLLDGIRRKPK
jgi:tetratricopeptide (TPR) repeat protein